MDRWPERAQGSLPGRFLLREGLDDQTVGMNSRVHPKYKTGYRVTNRASYDRALVRRGDITVWLSPEAVTSWKPKRTGRPVGQPKYSDLAIETALAVRLVFHLPLRQTEGFLSSLFEMMGLDLTAPDHTTLSRRGQHSEMGGVGDLVAHLRFVHPRL